MQLKLMSFNINGIRARPHQLEQIRDVYDPDIIGLQAVSYTHLTLPTNREV